MAKPRTKPPSSLPKKEYKSPLRDEQAAETRLRVIEAATRLLSRGAAALTIPAVAREAGVAVPTVYRYFPSKEALEDGVASYVRTLIGVPDARVAGGVDGWIARTGDTWGKSTTIDRSVYPVLLAAIARDVFDPRGKRRRELTERSLATDLEGIAEPDRAMFVDVVTAFSSTTGLISFLRTGLDASEAVERFGWLVRRLFASLERAPATRRRSSAR